MATYTKLTEDIITSILADYQIGELDQFTLMDGGLANSSCVLSTSKGKYVLSVCDEKSREEIEQLTKLLEFLNGHDFFTSRLILTKEGGGYCSYGEKPVYVKEYIEGEIGGDPSECKIEQVGEALAALHRITAPDFLPDQFSYGIEQFDQLIEADNDYGKWLGDKQRLISPYITDYLPKGLVHGDLFWDNILFDDETLTAMLDFEEGCHTHLVFDLGMSAAGCCSKDGTLDMNLTAALVRGYQRERKLTPDECRALPYFIIYAATCTSFWRYRQFNVVRPDPEMSKHYQQMSRLADFVENIDDSLFSELFV